MEIEILLASIVVVNLQDHTKDIYGDFKEVEE